MTRMQGKGYLLVLLLCAGLGLMARAGAAAMGDSPALELPDLDGRSHELGEWRGKVVLVNFWATWCGPCQAEVRNLKRYQEAYGAKGLQIIGVGLDDRAKLRNFRDTLEMNYPVLVAEPERSTEMLAAWGNRTGVVPYTVLLDASGRIIERVTGVVDDEVMEDVVLPHLNAAAPPPGGREWRTSLDRPLPTTAR